MFELMIFCAGFLLGAAAYEVFFGIFNNEKTD